MAQYVPVACQLSEGACDMSGGGSASVEPQVTLHHEPFVHKPSGFRLTATALEDLVVQS